MRVRITGWCLLLLLPISGLASDNWAPGKKLDAWFDALAAQGRVNGSIAISENGRMRYQRSLGFARIENGVAQPADAGTRYRIGSVSRLVTAVLTLQLAETASITLDTPVAEFYPDLPNALAITYRDLLQERSGLADYFDAPDFPAWRTQPRTHGQLLAAIIAPGPTFEPRERTEYSHSNALLLGFMIEKVRGRPYGEILSRGIERLGLVRTYFAGTQVSSLESLAYEATATSWVAIPPSDPSVLGGAAGVVSNAGDLVQLMDALFAGKLVSAQSLDTLRNPDAPIALLPKRISGEPGTGLEGGGDGFSAAVYHFPERRLSIAITSNATTIPVGEIIGQAMSILPRGRWSHGQAGSITDAPVVLRASRSR